MDRLTQEQIKHLISKQSDYKRNTAYFSNEAELALWNYIFALGLAAGMADAAASKRDAHRWQRHLSVMEGPEDSILVEVMLNGTAQEYIDAIDAALAQEKRK